jgi:hypothetical protein
MAVFSNFTDSERTSPTAYTPGTLHFEGNARPLFCGFDGRSGEHKSVRIESDGHS